VKVIKLLNPFAYYRALKRVHNKLSRPAPFNHYPGYDEYWSERHAKGKNPGLLHRYQVIASLLPRSSSILDVGCGDGSFGNYLKKARPDCNFHGLDISAVAIDYAQKRGLAAQVIDPNRSIDQQVSGMFDCITVMEVLEHIVDAEEVMTSIVSLAKGPIFVTIPNVGCVQHRLRLAFYGRFPITTIIFHMKEHVRFWTFKDFEQWAALFELEIVRCIGQIGMSSSLERFLAKRIPTLFASQVIYELRQVGR
jgi:methionine biosynthesis protein MetW